MPVSVVYVSSNCLFASFHIIAVDVWSPRLIKRPISYVFVPENALFITINGSFTYVLVDATVKYVLDP